MTGWMFLPNPGREREGLGNAGIETFKGSPFPGIARECSQNSLDAAVREPDGSHRPVHLVFRLLSVPSAEIPDIQSLRRTLEGCLEQAMERKQRREKDFLQRAVQIAHDSRIRVLSIEDYGTTGLGRAGEGGAFDALVKSSGVTEKPDQDAMGSFGIGKSAAFAVSMLRTVFYSTLFQVDDKLEHLAQGKSSLVSHELNDGPKRATGYWGNQEYAPVEGADSLPHWLRRSEIGTTVASVGFMDEPNWHWQIAESLIRNFFAAINRGHIRFSVISPDSPQIVIDRDTLEGLFCNQNIVLASDSIGATEDLAFSAALLKLQNSPDAEELEENFPNVGRFKIRLLQQDCLPRRVAVMRNGMYIADNLRHFGQPMVRFPMSREFVAMLEPADRPTSGRVRDMENPKHDELSAERFDDIATKNRIRAAMKKVGAWVREVIKQATTKPAEGEILLDEMNRFFGKPRTGPSMPDPSNTDPETTKLTPHSVGTAVRGAGASGASGSAGGQKPNGAGGGRTSGQRKGKGRGAQGGRGGRTVPFDDLRNFALSHSVRRVAFTPAETTDARLEVLAVGVATEQPLSIVTLNGERCAKMPTLTLSAGMRCDLELGFNYPYRGPIRVVLSPAEEPANAA